MQRQQTNAPLSEHQKRLVPQHRHVPWVTLEADKVKDERIDHLVGQRVLLVQEHADEQAVGACSSIVNVSLHSTTRERERERDAIDTPL